MILKENDILCLKNGCQIHYNPIRDDMALVNYFDENFNCIKNDEYSIVKILRPTYTEIYNKEDKTLKKVK